jgi:hypothetical protein
MPRAVAVIAVLVGCCAAGAPAQAADGPYAPVDRPGPALTVPEAQLRASLSCTDGVRGAARAPVLLLGATTVTTTENYSWNWEPALTAAGIPFCTSDQPGALGQNMGDMQDRAEYIVYAIRRMHELAGRRIAIVGHSQGGMVMRWPLRFWPDTRAMVEDVIGMAATNHGSTVIPALCVPSCAPALWQQRAASDWTRALNSGQETFAGIDYTEIYSHTDELVQPNADDDGTSSLHGPGAIANVAVQDVCPADVYEHLFVGTVDPAAWALGLDALTHDGPADPTRVPRSVCTDTTMPGYSGPGAAAALAQALTQVTTQLLTAPRTPSEPALRCYTQAAGCPGTAPAPAPTSTCVSRRRITLHLERLGLHVTRVTVGGRALKIIRRGARRLVTIDLRGRPAPQVTVRIYGRSRTGQPRRLTKRYRTCAAGRTAGG